MRSSRSIIEKFEFAGVTNDIHAIEDFIEDVYRFNKVIIGNRNFKLFENVALNQLEGLTIP